FEHGAFWWTRAALVLREPVPRAAFAFSCGLNFEQALAVAIGVVAPKRLAFCAAEGIIRGIGYRRQAPDLPFVGLDTLETAHQVVFVERRGNQDDSTIRRQASEEIIGEPIPGGFTAGLGIGLLSGFKEPLNKGRLGRT